MRVMEVDKIRARVLPWIPDGCGLDIGFGGNAICRTAICIDLETIYCKPGSDPQHLKGDALSLYWFTGQAFDYVFSSHLLEDFPEETIPQVLHEWLRVLRYNGRLILYLPDEKKYRAFCERTGRYYNTHHSVEDMGYLYMLKVLSQFPVDVVHSYVETGNDEYSFLIVAEKRKVDG